MSIGPLQILLILLVVFLLFGAGKLPRLATDVAEAIKNFKKTMSDDDKKDTDPDKLADQSAQVVIEPEKDENKNV